MRRTKIVGTIGPSSQSPATLDALFAAGLDVVRMNFSHGDHEFHRNTYRNVREAAERAGRPISILMDLQGPKIRVGRLPEGRVMLVPDEHLIIDCAPRAVVEPGRITCDHPGLPDDVRVGDPVLLDDGRLRLEVTEIRAREVHCRIIDGGVLSERKGINLPGSAVSMPSMTDKDRADLAFGVQELDVDYVALSFVRTAEDVALAQRLSGGIPVIAKIEKPQAVANLDAIIRQAQGCMVARGDLGVEFPLRKVPLIQKEMIEKCNRQGKLVIVATQMLESMIEKPVPTRAEVSDVANAVFDGADAVMLSAETASGAHPIAAVRTMSEVVLEVEMSTRYRSLPEPEMSGDGSTVTTAVARAAAAAARQLGIRTIAVFTRSGELARMLSDFRPQARIVAYTHRTDILNRLPALWGVTPHLVPELYRTTDIMVSEITRDLLLRGYVTPGEVVAIVGPTPPDRPGFGSSMMQLVQF